MPAAPLQTSLHWDTRALYLESRFAFCLRLPRQNGRHHSIRSRFLFPSALLALLLLVLLCMFRLSLLREALQRQWLPSLPHL